MLGIKVVIILLVSFSEIGHQLLTKLTVDIDAHDEQTEGEGEVQLSISQVWKDGAPSL